MNSSRSSIWLHSFQGTFALLAKGPVCNPCLRNELSPISQEGHPWHWFPRMFRRPRTRRGSRNTIHRYVWTIEALDRSGKIVTHTWLDPANVKAVCRQVGRLHCRPRGSARCRSDWPQWLPVRQCPGRGFSFRRAAWQAIAKTASRDPASAVRKLRTTASHHDLPVARNAEEEKSN